MRKYQCRLTRETVYAAEIEAGSEDEAAFIADSLDPEQWEEVAQGRQKLVVEYGKVVDIDKKDL